MLCTVEQKRLLATLSDFLLMQIEDRDEENTLVVGTK